MPMLILTCRPMKTTMTLSVWILELDMSSHWDIAPFTGVPRSRQKFPALC